MRCSTKVDENQKHVRGNWGYCDVNNKGKESCYKIIWQSYVTIVSEACTIHVASAVASALASIANYNRK